MGAARRYVLFFLECCKIEFFLRFSLTVNKEGPNKGRPFFGCSKPREQSCGFFQWGDEDPPAAGGGGGGGGGAWGNKGNGLFPLVQQTAI